jgi:reactive intermediate/imine deaminase
MTGGVVKGIIVPGLPHPLLVPEQNADWTRIRRGFESAAAELIASDADLLVIYSTLWPSIIGHQIQALPEPEWVHVDELFHDLGSIPYKFRIDSEFATQLRDSSARRGLTARTVAYHGFPIDTGSIVALKLLNPENRLPAVIVSSNIYADRSETIVFGKALADALQQTRRRAAAIAVTTLSNRFFTRFIRPEEDRIHSAKDDEWNLKLLEFLGEGRLEDVAQLSRAIQKQIRVKKVVSYKSMWWLSAAMGQHNNYVGQVHAYGALYGAGGAVVSLTPSSGGVGEKEFDEGEVETYSGDRTVIAADAHHSQPTRAANTAALASRRAPAATAAPDDDPANEPREAIRTDAAPRPVGPYPHARRVGDLLYLSGIGPRDPRTDQIPGGPVRDAEGIPLEYDVGAQTAATIANIKAILEHAGSSLDHVLDVTAFLIDMDRDFAAFNQVYSEYFTGVGATRTTVAVSALPTPIAVELKVVAQLK